MLNNLLLQKADLFGVKYTPNLYQSEKKFKTKLGGVSTLVIYSASLAYLIYQLVLWQQGQFQPKIITTKQNLSKFGLPKTSLGSISFFQLDPRYRDPFEIQNNIITPLLFEINDQNFSDPISLFQNIKENEEQDFTKQIDIESDLSFVEENLEGEYKLALVVLIKCNPIFLPKNGSCASDEEMETYLSQPLLRMNLKIKMEKYNQQKKTIETYEKSNFILIDKDLGSYTSIDFQPTKLSIQDGLLFQTETYKDMRDSVQINSQTVTKDYFKRFLKFDSFVSILFRIDNLSNDMIVAYPRLGEVLAEVGSIVSVLLSVNILIMSLNEVLLDNVIADKIVKIYFPQFKDYQVKKTIFQKIYEVKDKQNNFYDVDEFNKVYSGLLKKAKKKLNLINQFNQLKQIQMVIHQLVTKEQLENALKSGFQVKINQKLSEHQQKIRLKSALQVHNLDDSNRVEIMNIKNNDQDSIRGNNQLNETNTNLNETDFTLFDLD